LIDETVGKFDVSIPSALRSAAGVAAAMMLAAAGSLSVVDAPAAQPSRHAMAQHAAAPFRPPPVFRTAPIQYAPPRGTGQPTQVVPPFVTAPHGGAFHAVNPNPGFNPGRQFNNPGVVRPSLPLNSPSALRPNLPLNNPGAREPELRANNPGAFTPAPLLNNPNPVQQGSAGALQGSASLPPVSQAPVSRPSQPLASQASVIRPLLKAPPGGFPQTRPAFPVVQRNDRFWPLHKDGKFIWLRGQRHFFVPVALLGVVLIGDSYWYPDGYVSMEGPACTGYTADGCQLQWRTVDLDDGGGEPQCVQYCPQAGPPPEQVATLPPPPPLSQSGACQTTIYSEPNFGGNSAPTGDGQPILSQTGWRSEIASIVVRAGIWDFFADENFGGESLRLTPGTYPTLAPEWTRHIGSFMCVEPGPPPA
jgi:Beta/Gamma crystallin